MTSDTPGAALADLGKFAGLSPGVLRELEAMSTRRNYRTGDTVMREGEPISFVGYVVSGFLRMQKTLADGRQHIVGLLVEGDLFGQSPDASSGFDVEAASDAEVIAFRRKPFDALLRRSQEVERIVLLNVLNELDRARDWMVVVSNQRVTARLAGFLLMVCSRFADVDHLLRRREDGLDVLIPISRADLAHLLGTRPESISRAFHALAEDGDIAIRRPDLVRIRDLEALAQKAGEESVASNPALGRLLAATKRGT